MPYTSHRKLVSFAVLLLAFSLYVYIARAKTLILQDIDGSSHLSTSATLLRLSSPPILRPALVGPSRNPWHISVWSPLAPNEARPRNPVPPAFKSSPTKPRGQEMPRSR